MPNSGLGGAPVGIPSAYTLLANGLKPLIGASNPPALMSPHLIKSRRDTCPHEYAWTISRRLFRAFSASLRRALDAFGDKYTINSFSNEARRDHASHTTRTAA